MGFERRRLMGSKFVVLVLSLCAVLALAGCASVLSANQIVGSGKLVTQEYTLQDFTRINAGSNFQVTLHHGAPFAVSITADDNVIQLLSADLKGNELRLDLKPGNHPGFTNVTMRAEVSLPALEVVSTSGNAAVHLGEVHGGNLTLKGQSNGLIDGQVAVDRLTIDAGSNGQVKLTGSAEKLGLTCGGNAILRLGDLAARTARVDLNSNAGATVRATGKLDYSVGGNGRLTYSGGAALGVQKTEGNGQARGR